MRVSQAALQTSDYMRVIWALMMVYLQNVTLLAMQTERLFSVLQIHPTQFGGQYTPARIWLS